MLKLNEGEDLAIEEQRHIPVSFSIEQNYPNPFNPTTNIRYDLFKDDVVKVSIMNTNGQTVRLIANEWQSFGKKSYSWDATNSL